MASFDQEQHGVIFEADVADWIRGLPQAIGLLACNDIRGPAGAAMPAGRLVWPRPDEVAVIGVDNDEVLCELADPPLSSVIPNTERIGYEAAGLAGQNDGGTTGAAVAHLHPAAGRPRRGVRRKCSRIDDRHIAAALRFIREQCLRGYRRARHFWRRSLCQGACSSRRFAALVGRAPKAEILRVQLQRAGELLTTTDFPLNVISEKAGFKHPEYLSAIFKKKKGVTPGRYRDSATVNKGEACL